MKPEFAPSPLPFIFLCLYMLCSAAAPMTYCLLALVIEDLAVVPAQRLSLPYCCPLNHSLGLCLHYQGCNHSPMTKIPFPFWYVVLAFLGMTSLHLYHLLPFLWSKNPTECPPILLLKSPKQHPGITLKFYLHASPISPLGCISVTVTANHGVVGCFQVLGPLFKELKWRPIQIAHIARAFDSKQNYRKGQNILQAIEEGSSPGPRLLCRPPSWGWREGVWLLGVGWE